MQHSTDSLDQLIVGKLVLTGISEEEPLAEAIRQSESSLGFDWDIALCLSDLPGVQPAEDQREALVVLVISPSEGG